MKTVLLQLERLRRHYDIAVHTYDHVSLLDLSHSLRIWVDLKKQVSDVAPRFLTTLLFKTASPSRKIMKAVRGNRYVFAYMPDGVISYGNTGGGVFCDEADYYDKEGIFNKEMTNGCKITPREDGSIAISNFCIVNKVLDGHLSKTIGDCSITRCNYIQWLGSDAVKMSYPKSNGDIEYLAITREMIVRRMANSFDGSHPSIAKDGDYNKYDQPIRSLLHFHLMNGLPLPYFILLKIAQDILNIAPKLLED